MRARGLHLRARADAREGVRLQARSIVVRIMLPTLTTLTTLYVNFSAYRSVIVHEEEDDGGKGDNSEPGPPPKNGKCSQVAGSRR